MVWVRRQQEDGWDWVATYLAAVDGSNDWATVQPLFDDAFDAGCVFVTADGEYDKAAWMERVRALVEKGAVASGFEILRQEGDSATYKLTLTVGGDRLSMSAVATLGDGRIARVEPIDPAVYSEMIDRSR